MHVSKRAKPLLEQGPKNIEQCLKHASTSFTLPVPSASHGSGQHSGPSASLFVWNVNSFLSIMALIASRVLCDKGHLFTWPLSGKGVLNMILCWMTFTTGPIAHGEHLQFSTCTGNCRSWATWAGKVHASPHWTRCLYSAMVRDSLTKIRPRMCPLIMPSVFKSGTKCLTCFFNAGKDSDLAKWIAIQRPCKEQFRFSKSL